MILAIMKPIIITNNNNITKNIKKQTQISEDELREGLKIAGFPTSDGELTKVRPRCDRGVTEV